MKILYELLFMLLLGAGCVVAEWIFHGVILTAGRFCIWLDKVRTARRTRRIYQTAHTVFKDRNRESEGPR